MPRDVQIRPNERVELHLGDKIPVPVRDYEMLVHKPMLNGVELIGNFILKLSDLENDVGYISLETDPTVPAWAKAPEKPTYTALEVGALPSDTFIPGKLSDLLDDVGFYVKPIDGIPKSDIKDGVIPENLSDLNDDLGIYIKPTGGIPLSDLSSDLSALINGKVDQLLIGIPGGIAELDQNGMIPGYRLPSYVDDVKSYANISFFPVVGEDDKIYIDKTTNKQYRWSGDLEVGYVPIGSSLALGETQHTAYRGDRGKAAYDHAMAKGQAYASGLYKIVTNQEGHIVEAVLVTKADITALGIPGDMPDVSDKADKTDTVLLTTLRIGSYAFATGTMTLAIGSGATASGACAMAKGYGTTASNTCSTALGQGATASGICAFANGSGVTAAGSNAAVFGASGQANGDYSMAVGAGTIANGAYQFVFGEQNIPETIPDYDNWPTWTPNTLYSIGNTVQRTETTYYNSGSSTTICYYECIEANSDSEFIGAKWKKRAKDAGKYLEIVGNGVENTFAGESGSNARALDWDGNEYLAGDIYVRCNSDSTGGSKLITADDIPSVPVTDVQINGTTILQNGIANIPAAASGNLGLVRTSTNGSYGINVINDGGTSGDLRIKSASSDGIKAGSQNYQPITPSRQHESAFYALSKLAGEDLKNVTVTVGTYPDASKQAIQKLFGLDGILGDYESATASKAYAIGETFIYNGKRYSATVAIAQGDVIAPGTNCKLDPLNSSYVLRNAIGVDGGLYVKGNGGIAILASDTALIKAGANNNRPITAYTAKDAAFYGLAKAANDPTQASSSNPVGTYTAEAKAAILAMLGANGYGLMINDGTLQIQSAGDANIKAGNVDDYPIVPYRQHKAVYYGLSKLAGVDLKNETVTVGIYPQSSKTAIQTMLGIEADIPLVETVTGATVSITGMPNVRYICETAISELTITPPASGSIVVRFTAGSNCIVSLPQTVKLPEWFDISSLEAGTTYELIISDGVYGGVMSWAA